jgi:hypothetical protein
LIDDGDLKADTPDKPSSTHYLLGTGLMAENINYGNNTCAHAKSGGNMVAHKIYEDVVVLAYQWIKQILLDSVSLHDTNDTVLKKNSRENIHFELRRLRQRLRAEGHDILPDMQII